QALDDGLARLNQGHDVSIEAEADVVDHTTKEAIQHKQVKSPNPDQVGRNFLDAAKQLAGKKNKKEVPPKGYKRVADVRVKEENGMFEKTGAELHDYLKQMKEISDEALRDLSGDQNSIIEGL